MAYVEVRKSANVNTYWLDGRRLSTGDRVLLQLRGNVGWEAVTVETVGGNLKIRTEAEDGHALITSHDPRAELKWP